VRKILRGRDQTREGSQLKFHMKEADDGNRVTHDAWKNPIDSVPPSNRDMMCSPCWKPINKKLWISVEGFRTGLKTNFFNTNQAWEEPTVGPTDVYPGGHYEVGNQWRSRMPHKELS